LRIGFLNKTPTYVLIEAFSFLFLAGDSQAGSTEIEDRRDTVVEGENKKSVECQEKGAIANLATVMHGKGVRG
jgi:hypothetical protein